MPTIKRILPVLLASLFAAFPALASAAVGFGGMTATVHAASGDTSLAVSGSNTVGVIFAIGDTSDNLTGITWGGVSMTKIKSVQATPSGNWVSAWCISNPASAATVTLTGGTTQQSYDGYYTGTSCPVDSSNTATVGAQLAISAATTVVAANSWAVMYQKDNFGGLTYTASV